MLWQNPEVMLLKMFCPTFVASLVTLAWKMSPEMPKLRVIKWSIMHIFNEEEPP